MSTKSSLLALLEKKRGKYLSGEETAAALQISRTAVWKAVQQLRKEGLLLEGTPGRGYRLGDDSDFLSREALGAQLGEEVPLQFLSDTSSTNTVAKQWAMAGAAHGSVVVALQQSAGRGRLGRRYVSPPGGVYMSVVLRPTDDVGSSALITAATAVAVCEAVADLCGLQLQIKWVNDLFYNGKKCCGILTEAATSVETDQLEYLVVGIGVNYAVPAAYFTEELAGIGTSLYPHGGAPVPRANLLAEIYRRLLAAFAHLKEKCFLAEYRRRSLVLGHKVTVLAKPSYEATAIAIDDEAHLIVEKPNGTTNTLVAGEISVLPHTV